MAIKIFKSKKKQPTVKRKPANSFNVRQVSNDKLAGFAETILSRVQRTPFPVPSHLLRDLHVNMVNYRMAYIEWQVTKTVESTYTFQFVRNMLRETILSLYQHCLHANNYKKATMAALGFVPVEHLAKAGLAVAVARPKKEIKKKVSAVKWISSMVKMFFI